MDYTRLVRDKNRVSRAIKELDDGSIIALEPMEIHFPKRFEERSLAEIGDKVECVGLFGVVLLSGYYTYLKKQATFVLVPSNIREITIDTVRYIVLEFEKGDTVFQNTEVVKDEHLNYPVYMEFAVNAKYPWYIPANVLPSLFDYAGKVTGRRVGAVPQVYRVIYALANRDPDNHEIAYRYSAAMREGKMPYVVGLSNGSMLIDGTFNRLMGGYLADNIVASILNPDTKVTDSEKVMKGSPD